MKDIPIISSDLIHPVGHHAFQRRSERQRQRPSLFAHDVLHFWQGDLHTHSRVSTRAEFGYTESMYDLEEILAYYDKLGLAFVAITDHSSKPACPAVQAVSSPICQSLLENARRITSSNQQRQGGIVALAGVEANLLFDAANHPQLDLPDEVLGQLDLVIASRHGIAREKEPPAIKESLLFAIRHPLVDVIGHLDRYTRRDGEQPPDY
jgi:DNA polymerase (family X)